MALSWALTMLVLLATSSTEPERGEEEESQFDIGGCLLLIGPVSCRVVYTAILILSVYIIVCFGVYAWSVLSLPYRPRNALDTQNMTSQAKTNKKNDKTKLKRGKQRTSKRHHEVLSSLYLVDRGGLCCAR